MPASKHQQGISDGRRREVARRIFEAREDLAISQSELAHRVGCTPGTISRYESTGRTPAQRVLRRLSAVLERPIPYLRASDWQDDEEEE